ncbi:hypothetical protein [Leucobacter soli]|uniref:hypothetical protein n=1 Tax=Leucobacter soli TaxID=2812850 RepID=UPI003607A383
MIELAEEHDWRLVTHTKAACSFADVPQARDGVAYEECDSWNRALIDEIDTLDPDLIITAGATTRAVMDSGEVAQDEHRVRLLAEGLGERWEQMDEAGIPVLVIKDTPMMASDAPECASPTRTV